MTDEMNVRFALFFNEIILLKKNLNEALMLMIKFTFEIKIGMIYY